jgi:hypothetical protein
MASQVTVHSEKLYRVVLEKIDRTQETADTFAIKLSMRTRTPLPRCRLVIRRLPSVIKQNVSVAKANKLKAILEEIGGRARVESHFVTQGAADPTIEHQEQPEHPELDTLVEFNCPSCGSREQEDAEFCSSCREPMIQGKPKEVGRKENGPVPDKTGDPVEEPVIEPASPGFDLTKILRENKLLIAAGILMVLLTVAILKQ